jgi:serine/threonine protein kinase
MESLHGRFSDPIGKVFTTTDLTDFEIYSSVNPNPSHSKVILLRARHKDSRRWGVLKILPPPRPHEEDNRLNEVAVFSALSLDATTMKRTHHENVVQMYSWFWQMNDDAAQSLVIFMEYVDGSDLFDVSKRLRTAYAVDPLDAFSQRWWERVVSKLIRKVAHGLVNMHVRGLIHRDIKAENVLVSRDLKTLKICDFGLSVFADQHPGLVHQTPKFRTTICGTPHYMCPEMILRRPHDDRVDSWCLGVLTYELLFGHSPFQGSPQRILGEKLCFPSKVGVSDAAVDFIRQLLQKDPQKRPSVGTMLSSHPFLAGAST